MAFLKLWRDSRVTTGNSGFLLCCQEGRRGSEEAVPGPSVFPSGDPGVSGVIFLSREGRDLGVAFQAPPGSQSGQGPHLAMTGEPRGFSRVVAGFSSYNGEFRLPLVLAQEVQSSIQLVRES